MRCCLYIQSLGSQVHLESKFATYIQNEVSKNYSTHCNLILDQLRLLHVRVYNNRLTPCSFITCYIYFFVSYQIERYTSDLESLKDEMRDLFGEWESVEGGKVMLDSLGDMEQLGEVREETDMVENEMTESVENFKVSLTKMDEF